MARIDKEIINRSDGTQVTFYTVYRSTSDPDYENGEMIVGTTYSEAEAQKYYERAVRNEEREKEREQEAEEEERAMDAAFEADGEGTEPDENVVGDNVANQEDPVPENAPEPETPKEETPTGSGNETDASGN